MELLSGNEAIAQGAWEAGCRIGVAYPGTPSTETLETFAMMDGVYAEWCVNEKVAVEVGVGASAAGARVLSTMKHVGVNVAADPLFTAAYTGVDSIRDLRDEAVYAPAELKKKVYIMDEVHMLSQSAFNALLKILEEPPAHLMFILATTELHKVPATILSRCQRHSFKRIPVDTIAARLNYVAQQERLDLQPDAAALLARMADGGMRDALTLLDQCSGSDVITTESVISAMGLAGNLRTARLLQSIADGDTAKTLEQFRSLWQDGKDPAALLDELSMLQRDLLMQAVAPHGGRELLSGGYDSETLRSLSGAFTPAQLLANLQSIQDALTAMAAQPNPRIAAELCLIRLCRPELCDDVPTLCARVDKLEQAVRSGDIPAPAAAAPAKPAPAPQLEPVPKSSPVQKAQPKPEPKPAATPP